MGQGRGTVAVVAAGVKAPGGSTVDDLWASVRNGASHATVYTDERLGPEVAVLVSRIESFDPNPYLPPTELRRLDRAHHLALAAVLDATDAFDGALPPPERRAVVVGTGSAATVTHAEQLLRLHEGGLRALSPLALPVAMPASVAAAISMRVRAEGPCLTLSTACASGAMAIGEGAELLRRHAADIVIAGGVDAMIAYHIVAGFVRLDAMSRNTSEPELASRPFDRDRDGFVLGEGAGFVVLERLDEAERAGRNILGTVHGYATTADAHHLVAPHPGGAGPLRCMAAALTDAGITPDVVTHVNSHGTSTVLNDRAEAAAMSSLFGATAAVPPVTATKGSTGHLMGASGAVEAIVSLCAIRDALVPPTAGLRELDPELGPLDVVHGQPRKLVPGLALSNSFAFGGVNVSLVLGPPPID